MVTGQLTAYFDSVALRDAFINETEVDLLAWTPANVKAKDGGKVIDAAARALSGGDGAKDKEGAR